MSRSACRRGSAARIVTVLAVVAGFACMAQRADAGANAGTRAFLSWSATDTTQTTLSSPGAVATLSIFVTNPAGLDFKGGEFDLLWNPPGNDDGTCFSHVATVFRTSAGTTCTYLNRGTTVPVTTADGQTHLHVAWSNASSFTGCTFGAIVQIQFAFDGCVSPPDGCFSLTGAWLLDGQNVIDQAAIASGTCLVGDGGALCVFGNHAPHVEPLPDVVVQRQIQTTIHPIATDPDGDPLVWSGTNLPAGATVDATNGTFRWTPFDLTGTVYAGITLIATDPGGLADSASFTATVQGNAPPIIDPIPDQTINEWQYLSLTVGGIDPEGGFLVWTSGSLPFGASLGMSSGVFEWTPSGNQSGVYPVAITATDPQNASTTARFTITVLNTTNSPPVITPLGGFSTRVGKLLQFTVPASDPDHDPLTRSVTGLPAGATYTDSTFAWIPSVDQAGNYVVTFTVTDPSAASDTEAVAIGVAPNQAPVVSSIADQSVNYSNKLTVTPTGSDPDSDPITWTGANLPTGATVSSSTGRFTWTPTQAQVGVYPGVTLTATDTYGATGSAVFTATVVDANTPPVLSALGAYSLIVGRTFSLYISASDVNGETLTLSASPMPAGASLTDGIAPQNWTFTWIPTADQIGTTDITFTAMDTHAATDTEVVRFTVTANHAPVIAPVADIVAYPGLALAFSVSAADADFDAFSWSTAGLPAGATLTPAGVTANFAWTPTYLQVGVTPITLFATDAYGAVGSLTFTVTVRDSNFAPVLAPLGAYTVGEGLPLSFALSATDGNLDPLVYSCTPSLPGAVLAGPLFSWVPPIGTAGSYDVVFAATDPHAVSDTERVAITVVADRAPAVSSIADQTIAVSQTIVLQPVGSDPDGDVLTWSITGLPPGVPIDPLTGRTQWTPTATQAGEYTVMVAAADGRGLSTSVTFHLTVTASSNHAPVLDDLASYTVLETQALAFSTPATDPDGDPLTFTATPLPFGASYGGAFFSWAPTVGQAGTYTVVFTATDPFGASDSEAVQIVVTASGGSSAILAQLGWDAAGLVHDITPPASTAKLYIHIAGAIASFKGAEFDIAWSPAGDPDLGCLAHVSTNFKTSTSCTYLNRGLAVPVTVADDPGHLHVAWSNTSSMTGCTSGAIVEIGFDTNGCPDSTALFSLCSLQLLDATNTLTPLPASALGVPVTINGGGARLAACALPTVSFSPPLPDTFTIAGGNTLSFMAHAVVSDGSSPTYAMTPQIPAGASFNNTTGAFLWTPSGDNAQAGTYPLTVTAYSALGSFAVEYVTVIVTPANHTPVLSVASAASVIEASLLDVPLPVSDADGDPVSLVVTNPLSAAGSVVDVGGVQHYQWTPDTSVVACGSRLTTLTVQATDSKNATATAFVALTVFNTPPPNESAPVGASIAPQLVLESGTLSLTLTASDPEGDALAWSTVAVPSGMTVSSQGVVSWVAPTKASSVYAATVRVTDTACLSDTVTFSVTVLDRAPYAISPTTVHACTRAVRTATLFASDDDGGSGFLWGAAGLPSWVTLAGNKLTYQAPDSSYGKSYLATLTVTESATGASASALLTISVDCTPVEPGDTMESVLPRVATLSVGPSPAFGAVRIAYALPEAGDADVRVYRADGRLVREVTHVPQPAGVFHATWDGRDAWGVRAASGIYVVEARLGAARLTRRVLLLP